MDSIGLSYLLLFFGAVMAGQSLVYGKMLRLLDEKAKLTEEENKIKKGTFRVAIGYAIVSAILIIASALLYALEIQPAIQKFNEIMKGG